MSGGPPVPARVSRSAVVLALVAIALYLVARTTGAGWDVVILCGVTAVLLVGAVAPVLPLVRVRASAAAPRDAMVGKELTVTLELGGRARGLQVRVLAPEGAARRADAPCTGDTMVVPVRRGVLHGLDVELRSASPLGLLTWKRRAHLALPRPIDVAPRPAPARLRSDIGRVLAPLDDPRAGADGHELTRGAREYVDGDPIRLLHWPATARTGTVMVREVEGPRRPRVVIVVDLRGADPEGSASRAAGLAIDALREGALVDLATVEVDGPHLGTVGSPLQVGRRLARAVIGEPAPGPYAPGAGVVRVGAGGLR